MDNAEFLSNMNPVLVWFIIGFVFMLLELGLPGLVIIFFGVGAWITSLMLLLFDLTIDTQIIVFLVVSIGTLLILRKKLKNKFFKDQVTEISELEDEFIGKIARATTDIRPDKAGKVDFKGTHWMARSEELIKEGQAVEIIRKESITLIVKRKEL